MSDELKNETTVLKARVIFQEIMARALRAKSEAEPHVRELVMKAKEAAQSKAIEYQPRAEKLIHDGADKMRSVGEAAKPQATQVVKRARPRIQKAAGDAAQYVREHQQ